MAQIDRAFLRIDEGQIHYRRAAPPPGQPVAHLPLFMAHASPISSLSLEPLIALLGDTRQVIAPDTLGYGDSAPPAPADPDLAYYADSLIRVMDRLGLDQVDFYGTHTGAHIGVELLLSRPDRVRRAIFDGLALMPPQLQAERLARYAPPVTPDDWGTQFNWAFNWVRDIVLHYPYYSRNPQHRLLHTTMPSAAQLHRSALEVLKATTTYHLGYRAVFRHDAGARVPLITQTPVMMMLADQDPVASQPDHWTDLPANIEKRLVSLAFGQAERLAAVQAFLDR